MLEMERLSPWSCAVLGPCARGALICEGKEGLERAISYASKIISFIDKDVTCPHDYLRRLLRHSNVKENLYLLT